LKVRLARYLPLCKQQTLTVASLKVKTKMANRIRRFSARNSKAKKQIVRNEDADSFQFPVSSVACCSKIIQPISNANGFVCDDVGQFRNYLQIAPDKSDALHRITDKLK
jgi:hypothetical protein